MRHTRGLISTAQALRMVFVPSSTSPSKSIATRNVTGQLPRRCCAAWRTYATKDPMKDAELASSLDQRAKKPKTMGGPGTLKNMAIQSRYIYLVDEKNNLSEPQSLVQVLDSIKDKRKTHFVVRVKPPSEENRYPVCKIVESKAFVDAEQKRTVKRKEEKPKQLELNWAMDANDFGHRLDRMQEFLEAGKKVEIILAPKKRGRKATEQEAEQVLKQIQERARNVRGAKEWKATVGKLMQHMTLSFEGTIKT